MTQFVQTIQPDTPRQLYHYTQPGNIFSMLDAKKKCVCFWLKNNKDKNDEKELKYGRELMEKVRNYMQSIGQPSILDQMTDFDNSYSASFTEGVLSGHMLSEYGTARLEFDLRRYKDEKLYQCEYYTEEDLADLYKVFIRDIQSMEGINKDSDNNLKLEKIFRMITLEWDLKSKIASIKLKDKWEEEGEWRIVLHKQENDERHFVHSDGKERLKLLLPIKYLTGITLFYDDTTKREMKGCRQQLKRWKKMNRVGDFETKLMKKKRSCLLR